MTTVNNIHDYLNTVAPAEMALETDNVGFLVGTGNTPVTKIIVSLEITDDVITEAVNENAELIVSHHPLFKSLTDVTDDNLTGKKIVRIISSGLSAICMHTNLDAAPGGVNDKLAMTVGIADDENKAEPLPGSTYTNTGEIISYGRVGYLKNACTMPDYLEFLKKALDAEGFRYYDTGRNVHKVAVSSGGGGGEWDKAVKSGCDTFITADIKYSLFLEAKEQNINLIDGGHFCTENPVTSVLVEKLNTRFPEINTFISKTHKQIVEFY